MFCKLPIQQRLPTVLLLLSSVLSASGATAVRWGQNGQGSLTDDIVAISAGGDHNLFLRSNGTVFTADGVSVPAGLSNVTAIAAGARYNLALKSDQTMISWGTRTPPIGVPSVLGNVIGIAAGPNHCLAIMADGTVSAWGSTPATNVPPDLHYVSAVAVGTAFSAALKRDGTVITWGQEVPGRLDVPPGLHDVTAIAAGGNHILALTKEGKVVAWGINSFGQTNVPTYLARVIGIAAGEMHSVALREDRTVFAWGANAFEQCTVPWDLTGVKQVAASASYTLVLAEDPFPNPPAVIDRPEIIPLSAADLSFPPCPFSGARVLDMKVLANGNLMLSGRFYFPDRTQRGLVQVTPDGRFDESLEFSESGISPFAVDPDGSVVFSYSSGFLARWMPGSQYRAPSFSSAPISFGQVRGITIDSARKIYVSADVTKDGVYYRGARLNQDGSWNIGFANTTYLRKILLVDASGRIYAQQGFGRLIRLNPNGGHPGLDQSYRD